MLLSACAAIPPQSAAPEKIIVGKNQSTTVTVPGQSYWWYARVKMAWHEEQQPEWAMDVLLARELFRPLLLEHAMDIEMWRFHRRAAPDKSGHQFSFIFYAKQSVADTIFKKLSENSLIQNLIAQGKVERMRLTSYGKKANPAIEATSDPSWSLEMQRAWPYFAMGVSQLWLSLIDQYVASASGNSENHLDDSSVDQLVDFYSKINDKLSATWQNEGGHALLHHLNALFGYGEVSVYERRFMRF